MRQPPEIAFYHLTRLTAEAVLPVLLSKTLDLGERAVVRASSQEEALRLDKSLWEYPEPDFWLPHAALESLGKHGRAEDQPIWITGSEPPAQTPNGASFLFQIEGGCPEEDLSAYRRVFDLFNGREEHFLAAARQRWKSLRDENKYILTYWQQNSSGGWVKKHTSTPVATEA